MLESMVELKIIVEVIFILLQMIEGIILLQIIEGTILLQMIEGTILLEKIIIF